MSPRYRPTARSASSSIRCLWLQNNVFIQLNTPLCIFNTAANYFLSVSKHSVTGRRCSWAGSGFACALSAFVTQQTWKLNLVLLYAYRRPVDSTRRTERLSELEFLSSRNLRLRGHVYTLYIQTNCLTKSKQIVANLYSNLSVFPFRSHLYLALLMFYLRRWWVISVSLFLWFPICLYQYTRTLVCK